MFKKAKRKIVCSILAILSAVLLVTLGMIYISSYLSATAQNFRVLEEHVQMVNFNAKDAAFIRNEAGKPEVRRPMELDEHGQVKIQHHLEIGTFYEVKLLSDGSAEVIENGAASIHDDTELIELASRVIAGSKGHIDDLIYIVSQRNGETYVCFMDNTVVSESFTRLFMFTLLFGVIALIAIAFISIRIADRIVAPMEESYQKQKQFTADAGHELKTPVAVAAANIELLQREIGENKWLDNIAYENRRMHELVSELLELARHENRQVERNMTNLSLLVNSSILPYEASAFENHILLETEIADGIYAKVNENGIRQLVSILIDNAISHTECPEGRNETVSVKLMSCKGGAVLRVTNPGDEIPESMRKKLFERFYRADSSREYTGHYGLGLAIAKEIADANHAEISVACQDHSITFSVVFPAK